ncbi:hypothetical protein [Mesorhizobium sp.]|uniref:hypothetical protein n=1 Tax=Mesorhizobium sp. TaxID=1871066 RepID=UPI0025C19E30|nr:hypothetical protein [Mesorhizobium sp.]
MPAVGIVGEDAEIARRYAHGLQLAHGIGGIVIIVEQCGDRLHFDVSCRLLSAGKGLRVIGCDRRKKRGGRSDG